MIESAFGAQWFRRYRAFFIVGIALLSIQLLLAYLLPIFGVPDDQGRSEGRTHVLPGQIDSHGGAALLQHQRVGDGIGDDEDIINSNSVLSSFKDSVISKQAASAKEQMEMSNNAPAINKQIVSQPLEQDELTFKPICDITTKDAISAVHRAQTQLCKETIVNVTCAIEQNRFYAEHLPNYCPGGGHVPNRELGCYRDDKKQRLLSGYYSNLKAQNTPQRCIQLCLQSGFVFAGMQYSTECFCGNTEPDVSAKLPDPECNHKCAGESKQVCGGYFTMNVFETGIAKFEAQIAEMIPKPNEERVKIAFLLTLNGRAVRQVHRLLKLLYSENHFYFIHVDSRQDYLYRELLRLEKKTDNIRLARKRYSTIWGGASLLKMLLESMKDLLANGAWQWDFVINLSESDFPVKSLDKLVDFLTANRDKNFVKSHGREVQRFVQKQGLDKTFVECDTHMWRIGDRHLPQGIQIDGGSDWVALSREFVAYVVADQKDDLIDGLLKVFNHTLLPAETFFHTALRNSRFCSTYVDNNLHVTNWKRKLGCKCQYKHVVDWCGCSPNDFKPEDWPRLLATENKQLFFARKFEPIVNQGIILKLEEWMLGPYPSDYPSLHNYWQNVYHIEDVSPKRDEALVSLMESLARTKANNRYDIKRIVAVTSLMEKDRYRGFLIHHEISETDDSGQHLHLELWTRPQQLGQVSRSTTIGKRVKNIEVATDFDQKEQIARNFGKFLSSRSEPVFVLYTTSDATALMSTNLSVLWLDPSSDLADVSDLLVDASNPAITAFFTKSNMKPPLQPGIWTAKLVNEYSLIAQCKFLIVPLADGEDAIAELSRPSELVSVEQRRLFDIFLPHDVDAERLRQQAIANSKLKGADRLAWIDDAVNGLYIIKDICAVNASRNSLSHLQKCSDVSWSSFCSDPKSDLFADVDRTSSHTLL